MKRLNISSSDIDILARIAEAEAGNQSALGKQGVIFTILNRAAANSGGFADSIRGVVEQRGQFEPMLNRKSAFDLPEASPETLALVGNTLAEFTSGNISDPTNGATFFQNAEITNQRGTNFAMSAPVASIGDHAFYNRYKLNPVVEIPNYTVVLPGEELQSHLNQVGDTPPFQQAGDFPIRRPNSRAPYSSVFTSGSTSSFAAGFNSSPAVRASRSINDAKPDSPSDQADFSQPTQGGSFSDGFLKSAELNVPIDDSGQSTLPPYQSNLRKANDNVNLDDIDPSAISAANMAASLFGKPLTINSGFRSAAKQSALRNAPGKDPNRPSIAKHSHHTGSGPGSSTAIDISIRDMTLEDQTRLVDSLAAAGFTGIGVYNGHIHADMRSSVPSTFGKRPNWGGWTNMPEPIMNVLRRRGFGSGVSADKIIRGRLPT